MFIAQGVSGSSKFPIRVYGSEGFRASDLKFPSDPSNQHMHSSLKDPGTPGASGSHMEDGKWESSSKGQAGCQSRCYLMLC